NPMDFKQIQELIKIVNKSNIGELSIEEKDFKITIKQKEEPVQQVIATAPAMYQQAPPAQPQQASTAPPAAASSSTDVKADLQAKADNTLIIKSPMIGTFYRSPSPDKPVFVQV